MFLNVVTTSTMVYNFFLVIFSPRKDGGHETLFLNVVTTLTMLYNSLTMVYNCFFGYFFTKEGWRS